jgi:uncharacterized protein with HEPN domain
MTKPNDPMIFVNHIQDAIESILKFKAPVSSLEEFENNELVQNAVIRKLEIIGEAISNLSEEFLSSHPQVNWRGPKSLRNVLTHQYFEINLKAVWEVINNDLLVLEQEIKVLLNK